MQAHLQGLFPPHIHSPNCHHPTPAKNPLLTMATITKLRIRLAGSLAKEKRKKITAQFNNITSLGYYILEKIWQTASLQRVD
ncbi:hypothetical protein NC651_006011 [Populus alba x Populus x berolinensis]|nr:hypothetical protein NC651_006011 [Populus alba x Populus x berolinensis]